MSELVNLTEQQKAIVTAKENKIVVVASAAAGKTRCITERAKWLLDQGIPGKEIVVITFTNAAADEIAKRIGDTKGMFIGTIHSLANRYLRSIGVGTQSAIEEERFDKLFMMVDKHPECIPHVSHLICDETQDSTPIQFKFMLDMINPDNYMLMGDHRQSIYQFNGATPQYLIDLSKKPGVTVYELNQNYRNADDIYEFAREIISQNGMDYRDNSKPMRGFRGRVITLDYQPPHICRTIKKYKQEGKADYRDWFMLARTNDEVAMIMHDLERGGIPCETFKKAALGNKGLAEKLQENTVKVLTVHSSKGLEAKYVITLGLNFRCTDKEKTCLSYVAATRARDCLVWTYYVKNTKKGPKTYSWE